MPVPEQSPFLLGVNYPWRSYGRDFGAAGGDHAGISSAEALKAVSEEFEKIRETGAKVVRWFLFGDGRGGFHADKGVAKKPDDFLLADVGAVLQLAEQKQLQICFSLIDYLWLQEHGGKRHAHSHEHVLHFAGGREAFLQNVLIPMFREFRGHAGLYAWEIANEPEWAIREFHRVASAKLHYADFRAYAAEIARAVHEFGAAKVTLGSARLMWVRAWTELGLDYYQAHFYPSSEKDTRKDLAQQLEALPALDKPLWLGELPARDASQADYSLRHALEICKAAGLCGAAVWRWTEPDVHGTDVALGRVDPSELLSWSSSEREGNQSA
jgi:hypothetical protein